MDLNRILLLSILFVFGSTILFALLVVLYLSFEDFWRKIFHLKPRQNKKTE